MSSSIVLGGGRVIDPESGFDAVADVEVRDGSVTGVSTAPLENGRRLDVTGLVVSPGFVDLHSHGQAVPEHRLQALDGVTTALELEAGTTPVATAYAHAAAEGRPLNYGYSTSWALARMIELAGVDGAPGAGTVLRHLGDPAWQGEASAAQRERILGRLYRDLADGALGIGVLLGYAPLVDPAEYLAVARLAAQAGAPTFTHARALAEVDPAVPVDGAEEIVRAAGETGAHMHYCHVNSTSARRVDRVLALVGQCRAEGSVVTTEAYPYGAGSTAIGAGFLHPEALAAQGLRPDAVVAVATGERMADARRLLEVRAADPGALAILHFLDENDAADRACLERALLFEDTAIASDAMPLTWPAGPPDPLAWPLPPGALTHPRTAGTFAKAVRTLFRERGALTLPEVIARCSLVPARTLEEAVPAMRRKGRLARGSDADIVVLDPARFEDRSTYDHGSVPSAGTVHVLVNGEFVVRDGQVVPGALPGRPVRR
ncbi:amidohydrolase family protein [Amycolatopsis acidiphila]|uniref:Amidohydrolase family protein n=1 Tax=Amycolatopsis acidiphila TaxID=715473 RepID=A0A557ZRS2_9PSEU|nr:amidohydrolase family protein [Amycolatopsis acidiphila]TVT14727.1 amidohydrolase family protein [Amycolatopsis acidiphila]UIJ56870.1 amidohydrolase family protein [Amycolatopsis acidiphila]